jgi:uncharacterized lipoprotein YmbA
MTWRRLTLLAVSALTMVACATTSQQPAATVTDTSEAPATSATSAAKPVTYVTLPDTYGQNADVVKAQLEDLGLTKVELASSNAKFSTVEDAKDWKVAGMVPGAGSVVKSDAPVVLKVVKVR